jgi:hypothetical protein
LKNDKLFDLKSLAEYSTLGTSTIRDYISTERLPAFKVKGKLLFRKSDFDLWLDSYRLTSDTDQIVADALNSVMG